MDNHKIALENYQRLLCLATENLHYHHSEALKAIIWAIGIQIAAIEALQANKEKMQASPCFISPRI